jgi:hypothetical protein
MKRFSLAALGMTLWLAIPVLAHANCQSKVFGNSYDCTIAYEGSTYNFCMEFGNFGDSAYFDNGNTFDFQNMACACQSKGSANKPKFNQSGNQLSCTGVTYPDAFVAKVSGKKLNAQSVYDDGSTAIYTCKLSTTPCF